MLTFHIITLFPESFNSYLESSIIGRAIKGKKIAVKFYNPLDSARGKPGKRKMVDDRPFGGGPGMVMMAEPILKAVQRAERKAQSEKRKIIVFSPHGKQFTNMLADAAAKKFRHLFLICGHYEGVDARVKKILKAEEWSAGPYVLTGGELPALIVLDTVSRRLAGVLGKDASVEERRAASAEVYTRPASLVWKNKTYRVSKVLLSGHHREIEEWRKSQRRCG